MHVISLLQSEGIPTIDSKEFENIGGGGPGNFGFGPPPPGGSFGGGSSGGGGGGIPLPDVPNLPNVPMNQVGGLLRRLNLTYLITVEYLSYR